jgi:hypothetical protein
VVEARVSRPEEAGTAVGTSFDRAALDERNYTELQQYLSKEANAHLLKYSETITVAETVLLGFIFNAVRDFGSGTLAMGKSWVLLLFAWCSAITSVGLGLAYTIAAAHTAGKAAALAGKIAQDIASHSDFEDDYERLRQFMSRGRTRQDEGPTYSTDTVWLVLQAVLLLSTLIFLSCAIWCR